MIGYVKNWRVDLESRDVVRNGQSSVDFGRTDQIYVCKVYRIMCGWIGMTARDVLLGFSGILNRDNACIEGRCAMGRERLPWEDDF